MDVMSGPLLTIGFPVYDDHAGLVWSLQTLRAQYAETLQRFDIELLVLDNNPNSPQGRDVQRFCTRLRRQTRLRYVAWDRAQGTAVAKNQVMASASGQWVLCLDSHVQLLPDSLTWLCGQLANQELPDPQDLYHGVLVLDDLVGTQTHMDLVWRGRMWGRWGNDPAVRDSRQPCPIPNHGLGLLLVCRQHWLGYHPAMRGFGGEEGYLQEKYRRAGRQVWCLPQLRWWHYFRGQESGVQLRTHKITALDKFRNYAYGLTEIGYDTTELVAHFRDTISASQMDLILRQARMQAPAPALRLPAAARSE